MTAALVPAAFLTVFFAWPAAALILRGFFDGGSFDPGALGRVFNSARTWRAIGFTLWSATASTVLCLALGVPGA